MESYTVKQIADILKTNPETVRRWIRNGKLKSECDSKKDGNTISKEAFEDFLKTMPKYAGIAAGLTALLPPLGIPLIVGSALGTLALQNNSKIDNAVIPTKELKHYLQREIELHEANIRIKTKSIEQMQIEIDSEKKQIEEIKRLINKNK